MLLLDTHVVSELRKVRLGRADPSVARWAEALDTAGLFISTVTLHELEIGVLLDERRDPEPGAMFRHWREHSVPTAFAGRILPVDVPVARRAAGLHVPDPRPIKDAFIAATGVALHNPWDTSEPS